MIWHIWVVLCVGVPRDNVHTHSLTHTDPLINLAPFPDASGPKWLSYYTECWLESIRQGKKETQERWRQPENEKWHINQFLFQYTWSCIVDISLIAMCNLKYMTYKNIFIFLHLLQTPLLLVFSHFKSIILSCLTVEVLSFIKTRGDVSSMQS